MSGKLRPLIAALLFAAVGLALGLSSAPRLHEFLHKGIDRTTHECAATLLSSGSAEHSACPPLFCAPGRAPILRAVAIERLSHAAPALEFSRLEHAPPVFS